MITREQILEVLSGHSSEDERTRLYSSISNSEEDARLYAEVKNEYVFHHLPYTAVGVRQRPGSLWRRVLNVSVKAAAVLFVPLCCYFVYERFVPEAPEEGNVLLCRSVAEQRPTMLRQYVNNGVKGLVDLPDGTRVWLNSGSTLSYPAQFDTCVRAVALSGEAYFEVRPDTERPFCIGIANDMVVKVTGTEFNLTCYEDDATCKLNLVKGSVELLRSSRVIAKLREQEQVSITDDVCRKTTRSAEQTARSAVWRDGYLLFENTPMDEVVKRLERWYGVNISVGNPDILTYKFTAAFHSESLTQVLDMLRITSDIDSSIDQTNVRLL